MKKLICFFFTIFTLLMITNCSAKPQKINKPHYSVLADNSFTAERQIRILAALKEWNLETSDTLQFNLKFVNTDELKYTTGTPDTIYVFYENPGTGYAGFTHWNVGTNGAYMRVSTTIGDGDFFSAVMLHEFGHAWHLIHYTLPNLSIMHAKIYDTIQIECTDLKAFCDEWGCTNNCVVIPDIKTSPQDLNIVNENDDLLCKLPTQ